MFTRKTFGHIIAWAIFIAYESAMGFFIAPPQDWWEPFIFNVAEIGLFYAHLLLLRRYSNGIIANARWQYIVPGTMLQLAFFCMVSISLRYAISHWKVMSHPPGHQQLYAAASIFRGIYMIILASFLWLAESIIHNNRLLAREQLKVKEQELAVMRLEQKTLVAENMLYNAQIKPHILFNTLNFIYSQVTINEKASRSVLLLTDIMRFALDKGDKEGRVLAEAEWQQIENYITLQRLRFERDMFISVAFLNRYPATRIPPLILLTLIENMFVHGNLFDPKHPARIHLTTEEGGWRLELDNRKRSGSERVAGHKLGFENARNRLIACYGESAVALHVEQDNFRYRLELNITYK
jgi:two-component system LytT family sensor kinase